MDPLETAAGSAAEVAAAFEPHLSIAIELPVNVSRADKALDLVGGPGRVRAACRDEKATIQLWLRPDDPLSHSVDATKIPCHRLVLRLTRRTRSSVYQHHTHAADKDNNKTTDDGASVTHCVVGLIRFRWVFNKLADFAMLPAGTPVTIFPSMFKDFTERMQHDAKEKNASGNASKPLSSEMLSTLTPEAVGGDWITNLGSVLLLQPTRFSRIEHAQEYSYLLPSSARSKDAVGHDKHVSAAGSYYGMHASTLWLCETPVYTDICSVFIGTSALHPTNNCVWLGSTELANGPA
jgi:hypothetical protein